MFAVTRGSSLLFGIGSSALPLWGQEDEVAQSGARADRVQRPAQEPYAKIKLLIVDELGYVPFTAVGSELLFEVFSQRYERGATLVTSNLPFDEWTSIFGSERLTGALLNRLTHHVHILEMNGESYHLATSKKAQRRSAQGQSQNSKTQNDGDLTTKT
jgi:hypothetical protein